MCTKSQCFGATELNKCVQPFNDGQDDALHLRTKRMLHNQRTHFNVQLFLDLQFVDESLALDFESLDETNPSIVHFCKAVQAQVRYPVERVTDI